MAPLLYIEPMEGLREVKQINNINNFQKTFSWIKSTLGGGFQAE